MKAIGIYKKLGLGYIDAGFDINGNPRPMIWVTVYDWTEPEERGTFYHCVGRLDWRTREVHKSLVYRDREGRPFIERDLVK
jgi:hypothetical protein